jgi:hypothetical protein
MCAAVSDQAPSGQPRHLGKYEAKNQTLSPIKIGQKISANRYAQGQGRKPREHNSQDKLKTEVAANRPLLLNVSHEQKSEQITMTTIGYARASTDGQSLQSQTQALHGAGCARIFAEKISGPYSDRPQLAKAIAALAEGDTLLVCKLDRLARSTRDLLNTLDAIGKAGATFKSLGDPWADTTTPHERLLCAIAQIVPIALLFT